MKTLRERLAESEDALRAIRAGEVDVVLVPANGGTQAFTLAGAEHPYRVLIESMNEGALMVTTDKVVVYANQCFARLVACPLEQVTGRSLQRFLSAADRKALDPLLKRTGAAGSKVQVVLKAADGSRVPVQISIRPLPKNGFADRTIGMVVTDMSEAHRIEARLRELSRRLVQVQEAERGRVAVELDDNITQPLCAILVRSQSLADKLQAEAVGAKQAAETLREMLGDTAAQVERLARDLRPGVLNQLGLTAVLRGTSNEFSARTGIAIKLAFVELTVRLPADSELTLYRILQEALKNVELHARAQNVSVRLKTQGRSVQLVIHDDGIGFDLERPRTGRKSSSGLGVLSMHERAVYVGGTLVVKSSRRAGTNIDVRIPMAETANPASRTKEQ